MITLSATWVRSRWSELIAEGCVPLPLSVWDGGDAFTLHELGPMPSSQQAMGALLLAGQESNGASVVVELQPSDTGGGALARDTFVSPDGTIYRATGRCRAAVGSLQQLPVQIVEVAGALGVRRAGLLETSVLEPRNVAIFGLGTGGIHVALELAKAGVGHFALVDPDRLDVGNVARHQAGISVAGRRKVYVARDLILDKNPGADVQVHAVAAEFETEDLVRGVMSDADLIVCATDGRPSKLFINRMAMAVEKPAVYGGAFRRAYGGQILRVRPKRSPCYQCFVMAMPEEEADREIASVEDAAEVAYSDRPVPIEPGLSLDVAPIALMVARLALHELVMNRADSYAVVERDLAAPWYLWLNRPEPGTPYATWPPLSESSDEMTILRWYGIHFDREPACPVCGDFAAATREAYGLSGQTPDDPPELPSQSAIPLEE